MFASRRDEVRPFVGRYEPAELAQRLTALALVTLGLASGCAMVATPPPTGYGATKKSAPAPTPAAKRSGPWPEQPGRQEYTKWTQVTIKAQARVNAAARALETCFVLNVKGIVDGEGALEKAAADLLGTTDFNEDRVLVVWGAPHEDMRTIQEIWWNYESGQMVVVTEGNDGHFDVPDSGTGVLARISREYAPKQVMIVWGVAPSVRGFTKPVEIDQPGKVYWEQLIRSVGTPSHVPGGG